MESFMDYYELSNDFSDIFPSDFCDDASLAALLMPENYPFGIVNSLEWTCEGQSSPEDVSTGEVVNLPPLSSPVADMELVDQEVSKFHLLKAYGEAMSEGLIELAQVILSRLCEKASLMGTTMERLSHYLLQQSSDPQSEYLKQECIKNYAMAFRAFYEITPYGRFAHFVANASIQESLPRDKDLVIIHIIDLNIGEGIQWPPLLAVLGSCQSVRITCIDLEEEGEDHRRFERVKDRLLSFSQTMGPKLIVDKMNLGELLLEKRRLCTNAREREWLVFNCMVGLPHMGVANKKQNNQVEEFTRVGQELLSCPNTSGMLTYATGLSGHGKFSEGHIMHSHALFESMEWHFQSDLSLARTTMENLFLGECVSSSFLLDEFSVGSKLKDCRLSKKNLLEAKEMAKGGNYEVSVRGDGGNQMVLEWRNAPLVRVSVWV